jgi:vitamin B12/bleomycin/antimicrobial peptide transport system ATP-binding/permease protein
MMSQSREMVRPARARGSDGAHSRGTAKRVEKGDPRKQILANSQPVEGARELVHQLRQLLIAIWLSPGRRSLVLLIIGTVSVICATAVAQVGLNAWNQPFYEAIEERNFSAFLYQLLIFAAIAPAYSS